MEEKEKGEEERKRRGNEEGGKGRRGKERGNVKHLRCLRCGMAILAYYKQINR